MKRILPIISVITNLVFLLLVLSHRCKVETQEITICDTVFQTKIDTHVVYKPTFIESKVVDTIYITEKTALPMSATHYQEKGVYDLWISGYKASLDSIKTYNMETQTIVNRNVLRVVENKQWDIYPYLGFRHFRGSNQPSVGVMVKSPRKWLIGAEIGLFADNKAYYGFNLGYKITK